MIRMTMKQFHAEAAAQGVAREHIAFVCPSCGAIQSAHDWIASGAGDSFQAVGQLVGYVCIGRRLPGRGCHFAIGGHIVGHKLEIIHQKKRHPRFELASPLEAQAHMKRNMT
jgi:hypothetical protein